MISYKRFNCKDEQGNIAVLFAFMFTILIAFTALAADVGMMYKHRSHMYEMANMVRYERFSTKARMSAGIYSVQNPGKYLGDKINKTLRKNGFKGKIYYHYEETSKKGSRYYKFYYIMEDLYQPGLMAPLTNGSRKIPIKVRIDGSGHSGDYYRPDFRTYDNIYTS